MPASTNFLQWDSSLQNAETDSTYLADTTRSGGALTDAILASPLFNKFAYQQAIMSTALATMLVDKGYTILDSNFASLVAALTNIVTNADLEASIIQVAYATSVTFNAAQATGFDLTLTGNVSASTLTNTSPGQLLVFVIAQDGTGGRTFPWPASLPGTSAICPQPLSITTQVFKVRWGGTLVPVTPALWITASGIVIQPPAQVTQITTSGNVSNQYSVQTEQCDASSGSLTRILFTAVGFSGYVVNGKNLPTLPAGITNTVTYQPQGGQTIDGFSNYQVNPYNSLSFTSNGANWIIT
jgi:hypothetical protein